jgi:hypothetical protein
MKTAVEWLEEMFNNSEIPNSSILFEQAKEMEKEQIINAVQSYAPEWIDAEQYYNETFKSE